MQIIDNVGNLKIEVGDITYNHATLQNTLEMDCDKPAIIFRGDWEMIKKKIDKMFEVADQMNKVGGI